MFTKRVVLFLLSQNLSIFGSSVVGFAIIWYITLETSSGIYLMLATLAQMVPHLLISLYSGVWADRHSRKILICSATASLQSPPSFWLLSFLWAWSQSGQYWQSRSFAQSEVESRARL